VAVGVDDLERTLGELKQQGIEPERERIGCAKAARGSVLSKI
jgi:hypothetical protein